jgi:L-asparaginase
MDKQQSILLIYTGGTIGMVQDIKTGSLVPFNFEHLTAQVPELERFNLNLSHIAFQPAIDSSDMQPEVWIKLAELIRDNYEKYDGFVILHGSDTMAFTASALSFMLGNLAKPVILTGSQLPIGIIRTDGKENLITAIEIAAAKNGEGAPVVPEVAIYFEYKLYRGNRTHKYNAEHFDAFKSPNYPELAEAGVHIQYNHPFISAAPKKPLQVYTQLNTDVAVLKLFPGISRKVVNAVLSIKGIKAVVMETFGSGNGPTLDWFIDELRQAIASGVIVYNVTQCNRGAVIQGKYETSKAFKEIGVVSGADITTEAAITKLMFLLGRGLDTKTITQQLNGSIAGELSPEQKA